MTHLSRAAFIDALAEEVFVYIDVIPTPATTNLTISIDYELPDKGFWRIAGWLLGDAYSKWCLTGMVDGSKRDLERKGACDDRPG